MFSCLGNDINPVETACYRRVLGNLDLCYHCGSRIQDIRERKMVWGAGGLTVYCGETCYQNHLAELLESVAGQEEEA